MWTAANLRRVARGRRWNNARLRVRMGGRSARCKGGDILQHTVTILIYYDGPPTEIQRIKMCSTMAANVLGAGIAHLLGQVKVNLRWISHHPRQERFLSSLREIPFRTPGLHDRLKPRISAMKIISRSGGLRPELDGHCALYIASCLCDSSLSSVCASPLCGSSVSGARRQ